MESSKRLQTNRDALLEQYHKNLEDIYGLQDTLIQNILPSVTDELGLQPGAQEWTREWLSDTSSIFRISRRNKFTRSFCIESIQKTLLWRLANLWPMESPSLIPNLHCLPTDVRDPFGRPILILEVHPVDENLASQKNFIVQAFERLRIHLRHLYDHSQDDRPTLQCVVLLDLSQLSLQSINLELFSWVVKEVIPHFPGMIGAVFILNYSWAHSGIWGILKRLLPETALSRVFFPSNKELIECFTASALPKEFGGSLPSFTLLEDPIRPSLHPSSQLLEQLPPEPTRPVSPSPSATSTPWLSPTSLLNPFFGYPVATSTKCGTPSFRHGRRRKRDLLRTLAMLFWIRWRKHITVGFYLTVIFLVLRLGLRKRLLQHIRGTPLSHWLLSSRV